MATYILTYLGGNQPSDPKESAEHFEKYKAWLSSLGSAVISAANPLKNTTVIQSDGTITPGSISEMSGFTIIEAKSQEVAIELVKTCPFLEIGGTLEVSELMKM